MKDNCTFRIIEENMRIQYYSISSIFCFYGARSSTWVFSIETETGLFIQWRYFS